MPSDRPAISVAPVKYHAGDVLAEKYKLEELLGEGGMGSVWRARNLALEADVAVKFLHGELASPENAERLRREAHAAARLEHASAVRVYDFGKSELGDPFIVMELLRGETLRDLLEKRTRLRAEDAVMLLLPVVSALEAAHARGIVHRDLKPENIVLVETEKGTVPKVVDFGIAKVEAKGPRKPTTTDGMIVGSPDYMSPEQAKGEGEAVDERTDVWSLGVVLYEMVAGKRPFQKDNPLAQIRSIIDDDYERLEAIGAADERLSAVVDRALVKDPDARTSDMRAFGRDLGEWALRAGLETDLTGASIAAAWRRSSLPSIGSTPPPAPRSSQISAPVWSPEKRAKRALPRGLVVGALVGLIGGGLATVVVLLSKRAGPDPSGPRAAAPSAPAPIAASASAPAALAPVAPPAAETLAVCVGSLFPADAFEVDARLDKVCTAIDPRQGATALRAEIARRGLVRNETTAAMRQWSNLGWFEMAAFAVAQHACCPGERATFELPASVGTCPELGPLLDELGKTATTAGDADLAVEKFRDAARCVERGHRLNADLKSPYSYTGPPSGGAGTAFKKILERASKRRKR
mgnify:CR=1 FL=1